MGTVQPASNTTVITHSTIDPRIRQSCDASVTRWEQLILSMQEVVVVVVETCYVCGRSAWRQEEGTNVSVTCNVIILSGLITAAYMGMWRVARVLYCDKCPLLLCFKCVVSDGQCRWISWQQPWWRCIVL